MKTPERVRRSSFIPHSIRFNNIVDAVEARCMAADGPVTPTLQEISEKELAALWRSVRGMRKALDEAPDEFSKQTDRIVDHLLETHDNEVSQLKLEIERRQAEFDTYRRDARLGIRRYEAVVEAARDYAKADHDPMAGPHLRAALAALDKPTVSEDTLNRWTDMAINPTGEPK